MKELRNKLKNELENIECFYCSKNYSGKKEEKKKDNKELEKLKH